VSTSRPTICYPRRHTPDSYGYVRFSSEADRDASLLAMSGTTLGGRAIRVAAHVGAKDAKPAWATGATLGRDG
jgi:hypothetical protein